MNTERTGLIERRTSALDVAYLALTVVTFGTAGVVLLLLGPDTWFHRNRNAAFALLLGAIGLSAILNLANASTHGKIWMKSGPIYVHDHPRLFAFHQVANKALGFIGFGGAAAMLVLSPL